MYFYTILTAATTIALPFMPYRYTKNDNVVFAKSVCYAVSNGINWQNHNNIPQNLIDSYGLPAIEKAKDLIVKAEMEERIGELVEILALPPYTYYYLSSNLVYETLSAIGTGTIFAFEYGINNLVKDFYLTYLKHEIIMDFYLPDYNSKEEMKKVIIDKIKTSNFYQYSSDKIDSTNKVVQFINNIVNSENSSNKNLECITGHIYYYPFDIAAIGGTLASAVFAGVTLGTASVVVGAIGDAAYAAFDLTVTAFIAIEVGTAVGAAVTVGAFASASFVALGALGAHNLVAAVVVVVVAVAVPCGAYVATFVNNNLQFDNMITRCIESEGNEIQVSGENGHTPYEQHSDL